MRQIPTGEMRLPRLSEAITRLERRIASGVVTLAAGAAMTTVYEPRVNADSIVILVEQTANAAAAKYATPWCLVTAAKGEFVIAHANNAQADRVFLWVAVGG